MVSFDNVYGPISAYSKGAVTAFSKALPTNTPIHIHGDESASRDFLYATDLCQRIVSDLNRDLAPGTILHLARGEEVTIDALARAQCEVARKPNHHMEYGSTRPGKGDCNSATNDRVYQLLGFRPQVSLEKGLEPTWQWFFEQPLDTAATDS